MDHTAVDIMHNLLDQSGVLNDADSPALPEGKLFHLFLSHSSADRVKVYRLRQVLEAPPYNLKCFDDRDFEPGDSIVQNIQLALEKSVCTCFLLSPNFVKSTWCNYEQELANLLSLEGKSKVIPILLEQCTMPNALKFINYVDASLDEGIVAQKIVVAVKTDVKEYQPIRFPKIEAGLQRVNEQYQQNGCNMILHFDTTSRAFLMTDTVKVMLTDMGLEEITFEKVERYLTVITQLVKYNFFFSCKGLLCYMLLSIPLSLALPMLIFRISMFNDTNQKPIDLLEYISFFIFLAWPTMCLLYFPMYKCRENGAVLHHANATAMRQLKCFFSFTTKFNKQPQAYIRNILAESNNEASEEQLDQVLELTVPLYSRRMVDGTLEQSSQIRHRVQNHKLCLCQYAEKHCQKLLNGHEEGHADVCHSDAMRRCRGGTREDRQPLLNDNQHIV